MLTSSATAKLYKSLNCHRDDLKAEACDVTGGAGKMCSVMRETAAAAPQRPKTRKQDERPIMSPGVRVIHQRNIGSWTVRAKVRQHAYGEQLFEVPLKQFLSILLMLFLCAHYNARACTRAVLRLWHDIAKLHIVSRHSFCKTTDDSRCNCVLFFRFGCLFIYLLLFQYGRTTVEADVFTFKFVSRNAR